jgi:hypothetical protein
MQSTGRRFTLGRPAIREVCSGEISLLIVSSASSDIPGQPHLTLKSVRLMDALASVLHMGFLPKRLFGLLHAFLTVGLALSQHVSGRGVTPAWYSIIVKYVCAFRALGHRSWTCSACRLFPGTQLLLKKAGVRDGTKRQQPCRRTGFQAGWFVEVDKFVPLIRPCYVMSFSASPPSDVA